MENPQSLLAIDVGQSGSRISLNGEIRDISRAMHAGEPIENAVGAILDELKINSPYISLSLTGLYGDVGDVSRFLKVCNKYANTKEVLVIDDGLANFAGNLGGDSGVALVLGGGVVAVGGNLRKFSHSDGLSSFFGDEGGGFWLGSRGLTRALATKDKRDSEIELMEFFKNEIELYENLKSKNSPEASLLAIKSAATLLAAADHEIEIAKKIRDEGAKLLAKTVVSAWRKIGEIDSAFSVSISGGLAKNINYQNTIMKEINFLEANAKLVSSRGDNLAGAIWLFHNNKEDVRPMLGWARA